MVVLHLDRLPIAGIKPGPHPMVHQEQRNNMASTSTTWTYRGIMIKTVTDRTNNGMAQTMSRWLVTAQQGMMSKWTASVDDGTPIGLVHKRHLQRHRKCVTKSIGRVLNQLQFAEWQQRNNIKPNEQ